ncbi:replication factor C large subunit [Candidatus Woesearchaeota archaeon]|nr:replication factor C large subunit [Candidatus Woesearchaeota archaeon]
MGAKNWIDKYSPLDVKDVYGQDKALYSLKQFIADFKNQKKKALLFYGPSGVGKTSSVYALANQNNLEVVEMNASDFRDKKNINSVIGAASKQMSLFSKQKVILIDEVDGISGRKDYGGAAALVKLIKESSFPIIMTANNPFDNKFSKLRRKAELVQFNPLDTDAMFNVLKNICEKEGIKYEATALKTLARRSAGDARGAVNDLQIIASENDEVSKEAIDELSERNKLDTMMNALTKIFKTKDEKIALSAFDSVAEDFDQRFLWLDANLPKEYEGEDLARAYDKLSRADVFKGRIRRWQHWRFLSYVNNLITAGIAVSKDEKSKGFVQYKPTGRLLKIWWANQKAAKKKAIAEKIALKTHSSKKEIMKNIEYFKAIFKNDSEMAEDIAEYADLDKEEVEWLKK